MRSRLSALPCHSAIISRVDWDHLTGILANYLGSGNVLNIIAAGRAGFAISYGLDRRDDGGGVLGVFIWKEFRDAPRERTLYRGDVCLLLIGLALIIVAKT